MIKPQSYLSILLACFLLLVSDPHSNSVAAQGSCPPHYSGCAHEFCEKFQKCRSTVTTNYSKKTAKCDDDYVRAKTKCAARKALGLLDAEGFANCLLAAEAGYDICLSGADDYWCSAMKTCCSVYHPASGSCYSYDLNCPPFCD